MGKAFFPVFKGSDKREGISFSMRGSMAIKKQNTKIIFIRRRGIKNLLAL